jgi:RES domain-containing protein
MIVFRLCRNNYTDFLSGIGAEKVGGRWNSRGIKMVYASGSRSLCTAELAVHIPLGIIPVDYRIVEIKIPSKIRVQNFVISKLPPDWKIFPHPVSTQLIGNEFIKQNKYAVCKVPSAVVPGDFNFLINPYHKDFHLIEVRKTEPFEFDHRLFKK